jgi:hypothetical protein
MPHNQGAAMVALNLSSSSSSSPLTLSHYPAPEGITKGADCLVNTAAGPGVNSCIAQEKQKRPIGRFFV